MDKAIQHAKNYIEISDDNLNIARNLNLNTNNTDLSSFELYLLFLLYHAFLLDIHQQEIANNCRDTKQSKTRTDVQNCIL